MNHDTQRPALPPLVGTVLTDGCHSIDNLLAAAWKTLHLNQLLLRAGFSKRHGIEVTETVFTHGVEMAERLLGRDVLSHRARPVQPGEEGCPA